MDIREQVEKVNIAEDLEGELLREIGSSVVDGYLSDVNSRRDWEKDAEKWTKMALQTVEMKTYPWPKASNVKYPLISTAAMQFAARAYPSLVPSDGRIVKCKVIGYDMDGQKAARAERIEKHMSYQIMDEMEDWEDDMDRLLVILPILGIAFKKTYFCPVKGRNVSKLILPEDFVMNYWAKDPDEAERVTEVLYKTKREVKELQLNGVYLEDVELGDPQPELLNKKDRSDSSGTIMPSQVDETSPYEILEQHGFWDLDDDGYAEPYIFTVEANSRKVLRIAARFVPEGIKQDEKGKILKIEPIKYYTKYGCIPNPDGSGYDIGFGRLLGSINESVDTLINQLIDSGSLNNLQSGFVGKGLRLNMRDQRFTPGEWKAVNSSIEDLRKQIMPLPTKEPSSVLFQLLGLMIQSAKELASVAEIFVGKMPGQNTPAYTTKETVEQGMKLFTAIYKRVYRSMRKEFRKLYNLNKVYLDPMTQQDVLDVPVQQSDYQGSDNDVIPAADPMAASRTDKEGTAKNILSLLPIGTINPMAATEFALESMEVPAKERFLMEPQPKEDPKVKQMEMQSQMKQQESQQKMQMESEKHQMNMQVKALELQLKQMEMQLEAQQKQLEMVFKKKSMDLDMQRGVMEHQMGMQQQMQQHKMDSEMQKENHSMMMKQQKEKKLLSTKGEQSKAGKTMKSAKK